ncbi:hypothetical protein L873DRAFT_1795693 [Choiromyces venosus 120613-1]|uniref:Uncharacterized protein n=1 Tax=Choiromyces venosus 120613-1 TaxID=1336337 RepID=A0A3N4IVU7_9PEZI|nr:hypothetical protein L873DRAFT_1795693 [Choiromyces venosus 120613-1]
MSRCRSSSRSGKGKQPEAPRLRLETIPEEHGATSENSEEGSFDAYDVLSPLYQQALATRARIEPKVSLFPELAAQSEECLDQEILYVSDAFFGGVEEEDPAEA